MPTKTDDFGYVMHFLKIVFKKSAKIQDIKKPFPIFPSLRSKGLEKEQSTIPTFSFPTHQFILHWILTPLPQPPLKLFFTKVHSYHSVLKPKKTSKQKTIFQSLMYLTSLQVLKWLTTPFFLKTLSFPTSMNATINQLSFNLLFTPSQSSLGVFSPSFPVDAGF